MNAQIKYRSFPEFLKKYGKPKCKTCEGCLDSLMDYMKNEVPANVLDYDGLKIPKWLQDSYEDWMSKGIVGERSL